MNSLFSSFDPQSFWSLPLAWASALTALLWMPCGYWAALGASQVGISTSLKALRTELSLALGSWSHPAVALAPLSLFLFIALNNGLGLLPYIFTAPSHLSFTMALATPLWLGHFCMAWMKLPQMMLAHLVPTGTPVGLMPLMVMIELTSNLIRPITLSVRLAANMMAGHLLFTLITQSAALMSYPLLAAVMLSVVALGVLETAVSLIQAYVFSVLSSLYLSEVNSPLLY